MAKGGKRPGAGRKKGTKNAATLEKEQVLAVYRQRVLRNADHLFNSQMTLARGQTYLYKIEKERIVGPKGGISYRSKKPELVTAQWEIEAYLEREIDENPELEERGATYYFLTTKDPDTRTIDSMMDRTFGKSIQPIGGDKDNPITVIVRKYGGTTTP